MEKILSGCVCKERKFCCQKKGPKDDGSNNSSKENEESYDFSRELEEILTKIRLSKKERQSIRMAIDYLATHKDEIESIVLVENGGRERVFELHNHLRGITVRRTQGAKRLQKELLSADKDIEKIYAIARRKALKASKVHAKRGASRRVQFPKMNNAKQCSVEKDTLN